MINASNPENVKHWVRLCQTDPKHTKPFKKAGGFSGTDISPAYRIQRLTEEFGPCGKGWGYTIHERWRESFPSKEGTSEFVFVQLSLWWVEDGERYETGPQIGGTEAGRTPDESYKMAVTDALGKCALLLGVSADVYLGLFDDSKYTRRQEERREKPKDDGEREAYGKYSQWFASVWTEESYRAVLGKLSQETSQALKSQLEIARADAERRTQLATLESLDEDTLGEVLLWVDKTPVLKDLEKFCGWALNAEPSPFNDEQKRKLLRALERQQRKQAQPARARF